MSKRHTTYGISGYGADDDLLAGVLKGKIETYAARDGSRRDRVRGTARMIVVDTGGWYAVFDSAEPAHEAVTTTFGSDSPTPH